MPKSLILLLKASVINIYLYIYMYYVCVCGCLSVVRDAYEYLFKLTDSKRKYE